MELFNTNKEKNEISGFKKENMQHPVGFFNIKVYNSLRKMFRQLCTSYEIPALQVEQRFMSFCKCVVYVANVNLSQHTHLLLKIVYKTYNNIVKAVIIITMIFIQLLCSYTSPFNVDNNIVGLWQTNSQVNAL